MGSGIHVRATEERSKRVRIYLCSKVKVPERVFGWFELDRHSPKRPKYARASHKP
jgi:hypothetical protein